MANDISSKGVLPILTSGLASAAIAFSGLSAWAKPPTASNGTTLAASKTLEICVVRDSGNWRHYGEISVWNEGAIDTEGFSIHDFIEQKAERGPNWNTLCDSATITPKLPLAEPWVIPAGTTLETATVFDYVCEGPAGTSTEDVRNTAQVTITNHSGHLGTPFGPEPKATVYAAELASLPYCEEDSEGCTLTIGYWGTHREEWPDGYSPDAPFFSSGYTWGALLPNTNAGSNSNGYIQLARQWIGVTLNLANGASMPSGLKTDTYDPATNYFTSTTVTAEQACPQASSCGMQKTWAAVLDIYNNGAYEGGPAHCE